MQGRVAFTGRVVPLLIAIGLGLQALEAPAPIAAGPLAQGVPTSDEEQVRAMQMAEQQLGERARAWPQAYPLPAARPRPPFPGGVLQGPYPWETPGSPFLAVAPFREINYMGLPPDTQDPCYGRLRRDYLTPITFRLNYLEAVPYLLQGNWQGVLDSWAAYLARPGTAPNRAEAPDDVVALTAACYPIAPQVDDPSRAAQAQSSANAHTCGDIQAPDARFMTPQQITRLIANWLMQCGYLVEGRMPAIP